MIKSINGYDPLIRPEPTGIDTYPSISTTNTVLSAVFLSQEVFQQNQTFNDFVTTMRVKALFRKGLTNSTLYESTLIWSSGITINSNSKVLGTVTISGNTSVACLERNLFFTQYTGDPKKVYSLTGTTSAENDHISSTISNVQSSTYDFSEGYILACAKRITTSGPSFDSIICSYIYVDI